jgi:probable rRNA maturation factor
MKRPERYPATGLAVIDFVAIENRQRAVRVGIAALLAFTERLKMELRLRPDSVAIRLVSDVEMVRLNETYRKKKGTTDVLSFPAEERRRPTHLRQRLKKVRDAQLGDIAISPLMAKRHAQMYGRTLNEEIQILILHGMLHLLGYDHETDGGEMERVEMRLRRRLGIA